MANLSTNLPILRRRAGLTQEGLAEALNVSRQAVGKWECGQAMPEAATLLTLADVLDCTLDQLMREELTDGPAQAQAAPEPQAVPDPPEEEQVACENDAYALFELYNTHMDRFAGRMSAGVTLILMGIAGVLACVALVGESAAVALPMLAGLAAAVFLFITGGLDHEEFQRQYRHIPDFYLPEEKEQFRRRFRSGIAGAVSGILLGVALMVGAIGIFHRGRVMTLLSVAGFFCILALSVGTLARLGILSEKFNLKKYAKEAARQR